MPPGPPETHTFAPGLIRQVYPEDLGSYDADVLVWGEEMVTEVPLRDVPLAYPHLQAFPQGEVLLAGASGRRPSGRVYGVDGEPLRTMFLGDALNHVFVSTEGHIWTGYIDEGVFGTALGSSGLVCFDERGKKIWGYNENAGSAPPIDDCYALNVSRQAVWFSAYVDWSVVRIENGEVRHWKNPVAGSQAIAVHAEHVLLFGGYKEEHTRCRLGRLGADGLEEIEDLALRFPDGGLLSDVPPPARPAPSPPFWAIGRDDALHLFKDDCWYRLTVPDAAAS